MKKRKIKTVMKITLAVMGLFCILGTKDVLKAKAAGQEGQPAVTELSQIMTADRDVAMKAAPEETAETLMSYEEGASVFVTGETADGWYRVIYQDKVGYVPKDSMQIQEIDVAKLDAEMAQMEQEAKFVVESVEKYRVEARRSKIWGGIIVALVMAIFVIGIVSGIRGAKYPKKEK